MAARLGSVVFRSSPLSLASSKRTASFAGKPFQRQHSRSASTLGEVRATRFDPKLAALGLGAFGAGLAILALSQTSNADDDDDDKVALDPKAFKEFELKEVQKINHNTSLFRFALENPNQRLGLPVASCLVTSAVIDGKNVIRPYTPTSSDDERGYFDLIVKKYEAGVMSKHFHSMKPGDKLAMKGPIPKIPYKPNMKKSIGMLAGGTGVTPMLQVVRQILKNPDDQTQVNLVFANIAEEDILLKKEFDELAKKHRNFKVYYVLEKPPANWQGGVGYIGEDTIKKHMPAPGPDSLVMVCGPPPMMEALSGNKAPDYSQGELKGLLKKLNYSESNVFKF